MTISPFTLVYRRGADESPRDDWSGELGRHDPHLMHVFHQLAEPLRRSIMGTMRSFASKEEGLRACSVILHELDRSPDVTTVGFWDIGSSAGFFPQIITALNDAQDAFTFFDIVAPTPAGIISRPERVARWAADALGQPVDTTDLPDNIIDEDFASRAGPIREEIGVNRLIGLVPSMIAGENGGEIYWNHFSIAFRTRGLMLVSTYQLREFAARAGKPFEVAVAVVALASLLVGVSPRVGFHDDNGCLFDYNGSRVSLVRNIRKPMIETSCMKRIPRQYQAAAQALIDVLSRFVPEQGRDAPSKVASPLMVRRNEVPVTRSAARDEPRETRDAPPISWAARESARFFVRLLAHEAFRHQPELAFIALAEREGVDVQTIAALFQTIDLARLVELTAADRTDEAQEIVGQALERRRRGSA